MTTLRHYIFCFPAFFEEGKGTVTPTETRTHTWADRLFSGIIVYDLTAKVSMLLLGKLAFEYFIVFKINFWNQKST